LKTLHGDLLVVRH